MADNALLVALAALLLNSGGLSQVVQTEPMVTAEVGGEACFYCLLLQPKDVQQVTWQKESAGGAQNLASSNKFFGPKVNPQFSHKVAFADESLRNFSIVLRRVEVEDEGCYRCLFNTYPEGAFIGRTCLQLYELHEPLLQVNSLNSSQDLMVSCRVTGRPPPTVMLDVAAPHLHLSNSSSVSVSNDNGTVTVTSTALLSGLQGGGQARVRCVAWAEPGPPLEVFETVVLRVAVPEAQQASGESLSQVVQTEPMVTAEVGGEACFYCLLLQPKDVRQVTWQKESAGGAQNLASSNKFFGARVNPQFSHKVAFADESLRNCSIVLRRVEVEDEGCYRCLFNTYPEGAFIGRTCLQLYELHEPLLQVNSLNSSQDLMVSCRVTGRPPPTVMLDVAAPHLHLSNSSSVSVSNDNGTVTVTSTALLSGLQGGGQARVRCVAWAEPGPPLEVFETVVLRVAVPEAQQASGESLSQVVQTEPMVTAEVGGEACFYCLLLQPKDVRQVTWQKESAGGAQNLASSNKLFGPRVNPQFSHKVAFADESLRNCSIVLRRVEVEDEGCYRCLFNTYPEGAFIGRTCLQLYELHEPLLQFNSLNSSQDPVVSCRVTGRPPPTVMLDVAAPHLHLSDSSSVSVSNDNGTVTVTSTALLSGLQGGGQARVRCVAWAEPGPPLEVFETVVLRMAVPEAQQASGESLSQVVQTEPMVTAEVGGEACLYCLLLQPKDVRQVTWQKESAGGAQNLASSNKLFGPKVNPQFSHKVAFADESLRNFSIVLRRVEVEDEGCYRCLFNTYPEGAFIGRTCLQLYELHEPLLQVNSLNSSQDPMVSCRVTGRPPPTVMLDVAAPHLHLSNSSSVSVSNDNGTVTVTSTALLSGLQGGGQARVRCVAWAEPGPPLEAFETVVLRVAVPEAQQASGERGTEHL